MNLISIIIPVYNSASFLSECLDSIIVQTLSAMEIICINDGSTDSSQEILRAYAHKDSRIINIDQPNQGVSAARNAGLRISQGKYIAFLDSDDTIEKDFLEKLHSAATNSNADIVFTKPVGTTILTLPQGRMNQRDLRRVVLPLYFKEDTHNSVCNKLYFAEILRLHKIKFSVGKTHAEDAEFNIRFLMHAQQLYMLDYSGYHYRETPNSATRNPAKHPYLQNAVDHFLRNWTPIIGDLIDKQQMHELKKERLINNVISQIYIYGNPRNGLNHRSRWKKLIQIVSHPVVIKVFREDNSRITPGFSRYKKQIFLGILRQSVIRLYLLTQYSYYRNRSIRRF